MTVSDGIEFNVKYMLNLTMKNEHLESYSVITNFTFGERVMTLFPCVCVCVCVCVCSQRVL